MGAAGLGAISLSPTAAKLKLTKNGIFGSTGQDQEIQDVETLNAQSVNISSGYSWQDVSGSRTLDTWYQAPSNRDIWFTGSVQTSSSSTEIVLGPSVNTSQNQNRLLNVNQIIGSGSSLGIPVVRVPASHYYRLESGGDTSNFSLLDWTELR